MSVFNVIGPAETIADLLEGYELKDSFPASAPYLRDVNIEVKEHEVDGFIEWCENHGLDPTFVNG